MKNFVIEIKERYGIEPVKIIPTGMKDSNGFISTDPDGYMLYYIDKKPYHLNEWYYKNPSESVIEDFYNYIKPHLRNARLELL